MTFKPSSIDRLIDIESANCPYQDGLVEIEGVVSPSGQGGVRRGDDYLVHCFSFSAWRRPGKPLVERKLTILRPVDPESNWLAEYPELSIHRIKVLLSSDERRAIFAGASTQQPDDSLLADVAEDLTKPVIIETERFGELMLDPSIGWFEGEAEWNGEPVQIHFPTDDEQDISQSLRVAERLCDDQSRWKQKVDAYAVQELLPLKNDAWLGEDESPLAPDEFVSRMTLRSISIYSDGRFEFWHSDGDLFWGHSIQISGSLDEGLTQADIPG